MRNGTSASHHGGRGQVRVGGAGADGWPQPEDVLAIEGDLEARLLAVLRAAGHDAGAAWGEAGRAALRVVAGVENLEERLLDGDRVDRAVLEHLERRFG